MSGEQEQEMTYHKGTLVGRQKPAHIRSSNPSANMSANTGFWCGQGGRQKSTHNDPSSCGADMPASIVFLCEQGKKLSQLQGGLMENRCQPEVDWKTGLACPPHREIQCSPVTKNGCVDLTFPLLPWNGYQGQADERR